jgi:arsenite methyltransferase
MMENECPGIGHPCGTEIAERAFLYCHLPAGAKVLDIGCGNGATVNYLTAEFNLDVYGIDLHPSPAEKNDKIISADAEYIPFAHATFDAVLMECSFSLMKNQERVLEECSWVLKETGYLIVCDMFAQEIPAHFSGCLGRLDLKETIIARIEKSGYIITMFVDYSESLRAFFGQIMFEKGAEALYSMIGVSNEELKKAGCGYYMIIATKDKQR